MHQKILSNIKKYLINSKKGLDSYFVFLFEIYMYNKKLKRYSANKRENLDRNLSILISKEIYNLFEIYLKWNLTFQVFLHLFNKNLFKNRYNKLIEWLKKSKKLEDSIRGLGKSRKEILENLNNKLECKTFLKEVYLMELLEVENFFRVYFYNHIKLFLIFQKEIEDIKNFLTREIILYTKRHEYTHNFCSYYVDDYRITYQNYDIPLSNFIKFFLLNDILCSNIFHHTIENSHKNMLLSHLISYYIEGVTVKWFQKKVNDYITDIWTTFNDYDGRNLIEASNEIINILKERLKRDRKKIFIGDIFILKYFLYVKMQEWLDSRITIDSRGKIIVISNV